MRLSVMRWLAAGACSLLPAAWAAGNEALNGAIEIKSQEAVGHVPVVEVKSQVPWAANPIRVDGDLSDWPDAEPSVVLEGDRHASWSRGEYRGKEDLTAAVRLCRDDQNIYIGLQISDDRLPAPQRISLAFADAKSRLILGWQDVGMRYGADDVHVIFVLGKDESVDMHWAHVQRRMDRSVVQDSFGSEAERLALLQQGAHPETYRSKIFAKTARKLDGEKSVTVFEAAIPWKSLAPYVPVSYEPLKMNIAVSDEDGTGVGASAGSVAWLPGLVGTYSAAHFPTLTFTPPSNRDGVDMHAQVPAYNYINTNIPVAFSFYNHGPERKGRLELLGKEGGEPLASTGVTLPSGFSSKNLPIHSEKVGAGEWELSGRLTLAGQEPSVVRVFAPTFSDTVAVQAIAEYEARLAALERNAESLEQLYKQVEARGLNTAYPLAYLTLQKMFIPRSREDLERGDSDRVRRNTETLENLYAQSKAYMEEILRNPDAQLKVPPRFDPERLTMKDGFYHDGDRPVFLWGPCVFWYLRAQQPQVIDLGFNSVVTEVPQDPGNAEAIKHVETYYAAGVSINASVQAPGLQLTGADAAKSPLLKEHPEMKNLDPNNFMPFVVQHPAARKAIEEGYNKSINFWKPFKGIRSYWLWNEPWYTNYSEMTRQDFIKYLKERYPTVADLNKRWKSQYANFEDIKLIEWPDPANYAPWYDFQQFRDELLVDFFGFLSDTAKGVDPRRPTHTKFMAASLHSFNIEKLQEVYDIAGHDGSMGDRDIMFLDYCRSLYPDKPLVNTEIHISYAGKKAVEMVAWRLALHGLADGNWWCWHSNQRFSDSLANAESMWALSISGLDIQRLFDPHMYALNQKHARVATLFPDVVERRSDVTMVRMRFEQATAQYALGLRPFYATEARIVEGELPRHEVLLAGESDYVKDSTYQGVLDYVRGGGIVIVTRGGFAHNEYGDPRDTSELIKLEGGEMYGEGARIYPLGEGRVICIDAIENQPDIVTDGGQALRGGPTPENQERRRVYERVLAKVMADNGLQDPVRIVAADETDPDALYGFDWRSVAVDGGYTLAVLPYGTNTPSSAKLVTAKPIRKIINLITEKEIAPDAFMLKNGPNLFHIELED